jgi:hypothetical protein
VNFPWRWVANHKQSDDIDRDGTPSASPDVHCVTELLTV